MSGSWIPPFNEVSHVHAFLEALRTQRWDDHRYYHHCRINQSLHLLSAMSFVVAYALLFTDPAMAALFWVCFGRVTTCSRCSARCSSPR